MVCYQSEANNYVFGITKQGNETVIILRKGRNGETVLIESKKIKLNNQITLQVKAIGDNYNFAYSLNGGDYQNVGGNCSGDILSSDIAGGFTGALIGLYSTCSNK